MGKDKQHSKASLQVSVDTENQNIHFTTSSNNNNNGDLKKFESTASPMLITKRSSDIISDGAIDLATINEKSLPDIVNMSKMESANGSHGHGIMSPFEDFNDDSDSDPIVDPPHQQLSSSSSASVNILMENTSNNNKLLGNVQVSQV
jgi:hypothetical protein